MKLIKQSFEFINQTDFSLVGIKKHIERCARVSYKSEDKITDTSYEKFVNMLESRGHDRPLEFGTVHLKMPEPEFKSLIDTLTSSRTYNDLWIHYKVVETLEEGYTVYVTTNYRYYKLMWNQMNTLSEYFDKTNSKHYPKRYTVHMILSRGVMDEFRTHVGLSHLAESTRYINYSKEKFGSEITFIKPCWEIKTANEVITPEGTHMSSDSLEFLTALNEAEDHYLSLLAKGWTPQQARSVLPLGIKSELISCGFEDAWANFMRRRSPKYGDPGAHPMAAEIADKLCEEFLKRGFIDEKKI